MSYHHKKVINLPADLPTFQVSGAKCLYEPNNNMVWIPVGHNPPSPVVPFDRFNLTPVNQESLKNLQYTPTHDGWNAVIKNQQIASKISDYSSELTALQRPVFEHEPVIIQQSTGNNVTVSNTSTLKERQAGLVPLKKYRGMYDAALLYFDQSDVSDSDSLEDMPQIPKMISKSDVLNDSGIREASSHQFSSADVHFDSHKNLPTKRYKDTRIKKRKAEIYETDSDITSVEESDFSLHDESSSCDLSTDENEADYKSSVLTLPSDTPIPSPGTQTLNYLPRQVSIKALDGKTNFVDKNYQQFQHGDRIARFLDNTLDNMVHVNEESLLDSTTMDNQLNYHGYSKSKMISRSKLQAFYNMPTMNWNFDLKLITEKGMFPYASTCHMVSGSGMCRSDIEFLTAVEENNSSPSTTRQHDLCDMKDNDISLVISPDGSNPSDPETVASTYASSSVTNYTGSISSLNEWSDGRSSSMSVADLSTSTPQFAVLKSGSHVSISSTGSSASQDNEASRSVIDLNGDNPKVTPNDPDHLTGQRGSFTSFDFDNCDCDSLQALSRSSPVVSTSLSLKYHCTKLDLSKSKNDMSEDTKTSQDGSASKSKKEFVQEKNVRLGRKRKADKMTDSHEHVPLAKTRPLPSYKVKHVLPQNSAKVHQDKQLSQNSVDDAEPTALLSPPPASKKRNMPHREISCKRLHGKRSYEAAFTPESSTTSKARRRLFVDDSSSQRDEDGDEIFIIPRLLKKLF